MPKKGEIQKNVKAESLRKRAYNATEEQKTRRAQRNAARAKMEKAGKVRKGDGKDVDHKDMNTAHNGTSNLQVMDKSKNRAKNKQHLGYHGKKKNASK
jgi:hypothetical protein